MLTLRNVFLSLIIMLLLMPLLGVPTARAQTIALRNDSIALEWQKKRDGYRLARVGANKGGKWLNLEAPSGEYTLLYSATRPDSLPLFDAVDAYAAQFPEPIYQYISSKWHNNLKPVPMNTAGTAIHFFPDRVADGPGTRSFTKQTPQAALRATWQLDSLYPNDVRVSLHLTARQSGYFSLATPTLAPLPESALAWGMIPGYWQGRDLQDDLVLSYGYGQGIPRRPIIVRERTASTLAPLLSHRNGLTLAVIPDPGTGRDPWAQDHNTHADWQLGLSLMNRRAELTPTAYHPVLGEKDSYLRAGETRTFSFRYTLRAADWYAVYQHTVQDIYRFHDFLALKQTQNSLTNRLQAMHRYVIEDSTSLWRTEQFEGYEIGAQAYLGGVLGSDKDAMKNSDYGAMWMLTTIAHDSVLRRTRLPYARNFKLTQQQQTPGFFQGAAVGQYYLSKRAQFTEEWGLYVEPIGLTYYIMLDLGNILLFRPDDDTLRENLRLGAEKLLDWQHADGHWEVAYDRASHAPRFTRLQDLRPTFYGLLVAYRILGDERYLDAARRGADWFLENATERGHFLGVCGDLRFVPDFATGQSVQALLDLFDLTGEERYRRAALQTARLYTTSVYTHPIATQENKVVDGTPRQDWEISQVGLSFEHGGSLGSATNNGPILLASHAGLFVRVFGLTGDSLFLDMARASSWGRDAFVDSATQVASYYWRTMDAGAGPYPHHAWWQIGWITDYLLSEVTLRSGGEVAFPRGFITPKVGPHQTYGFAPGQVFGQEAALYLPPGLMQIDDPQVDYWGASATQEKRLFLILLNNDDEAKTSTVRFQQEQLPQPGVKVQKARLLDARGSQTATLDTSGDWQINLPAFGMAVIAVDYEQQ